MPAPKPVSARTTAARARQAYQKIAERPRAEDPERFTKNPHEYGDILITGNKLGGVVHRDVIYWIERHTWGTNVSKKKGVVVRPEWAKLSLTQLSKLCGGVERKSIAVALAYLAKAGIIEARDREGCGATTAKMYKLTPERWKAAPKYKPPTLEDVKAAEAEADEETPEAEAETARPGVHTQSTV